MNLLNQFRQEKDEFFAINAQSPKNHEQRHDFQGLQYYPINPDLKLEGFVEEFPEEQKVAMRTSIGEVQTHQRYGCFQIEFDGKAAALTLCASDGASFLPLVDALAGEETHGAGRYITPNR